MNICVPIHFPSDEGAKLFLAWMNLPVDGVYDLIVQHQQRR